MFGSFLVVPLVYADLVRPDKQLFAAADGFPGFDNPSQGVVQICERVISNTINNYFNLVPLVTYFVQRPNSRGGIYLHLADSPHDMIRRDIALGWRQY